MLDKKGTEITAIGIGSGGSRIVSLLSKHTLLFDRFAYVSCDEADFAEAGPDEQILVESPIEQKLTPSLVRGLAGDTLSKIKAVVGRSKVVFVIAGLGGATGSGLAPVVASLAVECGAIVVGVAVMPFEFEKKLKFYAGVSLKHLRSASDGVIVIDNDTLLRSSPDDPTLTSLYATANREAVKALGSLLSKPTDESIPVGLKKLLGAVVRDGYALLGVSSSSAPDKAEEALAGAVVSIGKLAQAKEAVHAVVILDGNASLSAKEVGLVVKRLGSMINNKAVDVEYGVNYSGSAQLQASLLVSGFSSTKYDEYDPLDRILRGRIIDDEMDSSVPEGLEALQSCE